MRTCATELLLLVALLTPSCLSSEPPPRVQLYPQTQTPLRSDQVSILSGYVRFVDGKEVPSRGGPFELLPGCHVIATPSYWSEQTVTGEVGVTSNTGTWAFPLPMRAGYRYRIQVILGELTSPMGRLTIVGVESDLAGNDTRQFTRLAGPKDIEACCAEAGGTLRECARVPAP